MFFIKQILFFILFTIFCPSVFSFEKICSQIKKWPKGQDVRKIPGLKAYSQHNIGTVVSGKFAMSKIRKKNWIVIDARDRATKLATGLVANTIDIISDYQDDSLHEYKKNIIVSKLSTKKNKKFLKRREIKNILFFRDFKRIKVILFCNGYKCHRSSFAACELRRMGFPYENLFLSLGGYPELIEAGAKIK
jgi:hypothetical protein